VSEGVTRKSFESSTAEPVELFEVGARRGLRKIRARPRESSAEIEALIGHLFTLRDGLIVRLQTFPQREGPRSRRAFSVVRSTALDENRHFAWKGALSPESASSRVGVASNATTSTPLWGPTLGAA